MNSELINKLGKFYKDMPVEEFVKILELHQRIRDNIYHVNMKIETAKKEYKEKILTFEKLLSDYRITCPHVMKEHFSGGTSRDNFTECSTCGTIL